MSQSNKKLFLLDAYALIYRAHFAFAKTPRINSKGINTSVPFGFTNTLLEVLHKQKPTHIGIAFDTAAKTFRDEIFSEYKANRQETPEDIRSGVPKVKEIIRGFNIPILELDGYEADDVIGTLATEAAKQGFDVFMMTPDKDYGQIVKENVWLYKPAYLGNGVDIMGPKEVCEKWDIDNVNQVIDMLGLQGDTSDNIPGIPGFGPKTAAVLLKKYGSIENIIANADELKGKQKELVKQYGDQALLSKQLATIVIDVPVAFDEKALEYSGPNVEVLKPIFDALEFKTIAARAFSETGSATTSAPQSAQSSQLSMFGQGNESAEALPGERKNRSSKEVEYIQIEDPKQLATLVKNLQSQPFFAIDSLTDELPNFDFHLKGLSFSYKENEAYFVLCHDGKVDDTLKSILEDSAISKVSHNIKGTMLALKKAGVELKGQLFDVMLAHYLIEPEASHDLEILCSQYLHYDILPKDHADIKERLCERADHLYQLRNKIQPELEKRRHVKLLNDTEMPLVTVLAAMEFEGVKIDVDALAKMSEELRADSDLVQKEIFKLAGTEFNIGSPKQLGEVLFDKMKLIDKPK
ncbi:MAG TPA: 5'-3' exonuclease H3TH domain-containing protein, partial [Chryseolinea sp.]|nr:5'-3' exonuclease H3TH domain-containing protein [Chryseolinea sp.]